MNPTVQRKTASKEKVQKGDIRSGIPRFQGENLDHNLFLIDALRRNQLSEALGALTIALREDDIKRIEQAVPPNAVAGSRYPEVQMAHLDSERIASKGKRPYGGNGLRP